ncbi:cation:proton antiporter [Actinomadura rayongensis]|uniref:Cation/H(+) antiporter n=1 Tax=Actinomadura rayongensis TaxID=1429076 RepID=A0A6I4WEJ3_9ACTN|nr:cation:proton antiporter [Actinomadura rayongensis]MXQ68228.1 cation/H(+) antiporter [Actinomadura rayongensis]
MSAHAADMRIAVMLAGIALVLLAGLVFGRIAKAVRQPAVVGELVAGIALGPSLLGALPGDPARRIFPDDVRPLLSAVAQVGLVLFMFAVGWEFEKRLIRGNVGAALGVSVSSAVLAFGLGVGAAAVLYARHDTVAGKHVGFLPFALFLGIALSVTAFPVLARMLTESSLADTRIGAVALAGAAIDDVLAWFLLAYVSALVSADGSGAELARIAVLFALYLAVMAVVVRPLLNRVVWRWAATERWPALLTLLCAGVFLSSWLTTWIGVHAIFGAFLFGFVMPREPARVLAEHVRRPLDDVILLLLPVFFIVTGLNVDVGALDGPGLLELALVLVCACAGKIGGALVPARLAGLGWRDATTLGLLMNTRGLTELIILNAARSLGVLDGRMFTVLVLMAVLTTALTGPFLPRRGDAADPPVPVPARPAKGAGHP